MGEMGWSWRIEGGEEEGSFEYRYDYDQVA